MRRTLACLAGRVRLPTSDPEVRHLPCVEGVRGPLAYRGGVDAGKPRKVVCVHGCPGSGRDFRYIAHDLEAAGEDVVRVDLPGHGDSADAHVLGPPDMAHMAVVVDAAVVDLFGSRSKPVIVAHSLGSHVALEMVARRPAAYAGLLLIAPAGVTPHRALQPWAAVSGVATRLAAAPTGALASVLRRVLPFFYRMRGFPASLTPDEILHAQRRIGHLDFDRLRTHTIPALRNTPRDFRAMVAYAPDDRVCNTEVVEELVNAMRAHAPAGVDVLKLDHGGHVPHKHCAAEITAEFTKIFRARPAASA